MCPHEIPLGACTRAARPELHTTLKGWSLVRIQTVFCAWPGCAVEPRNLPSLFQSGLYVYIWMVIETDFHSVAKIIANIGPPTHGLVTKPFLREFLVIMCYPIMNKTTREEGR